MRLLVVREHLTHFSGLKSLSNSVLNRTHLWSDRHTRGLTLVYLLCHDQVDTSKTINSIWPNSRRPPRNTSRVADNSVLARRIRSANTALRCGKTAFNIALLNIRSLTRKGHLIQDLLVHHRFDFLCLTETWQQPNDFSQLKSTTPGFVYVCSAPWLRLGRRSRDNSPWEVESLAGICPCLQLLWVSSFRPFSNLPFLSKILEKTIATQLHSHLSHINLYEQFQSGFCPLHSTETAL